jgi:hypothetical protein
VECFFIGKQKLVLFPKYRENGWKFAANALIVSMFEHELCGILIAI